MSEQDPFGLMLCIVGIVVVIICLPLKGEVLETFRDTVSPQGRNYCLRLVLLEG